MSQFDLMKSFISFLSLAELEQLKEMICEEIGKKIEENHSVKIEIEETLLEESERIPEESEEWRPKIQSLDCRVVLKKIDSSSFLKNNNSNVKKISTEKSHPKDKEFNREFCKISLPSESKANTELKAKSEICGMSISNGHQNFKKNFECHYCDLKFLFKRDKDRHENIHTGEKPYKCQFCEKEFTRLDNKVVHERFHTGENTFKCQFCEKKFTRMDKKVVHERIHTGETPFKCQFCEKKFTRMDYKVVHERVHTGEKPHKCQFCDKKFTQKCSKVVHERVHTREKPYKCQFCEKKYTTSRWKNDHERRHKDENYSKSQVEVKSKLDEKIDNTKATEKQFE